MDLITHHVLLAALYLAVPAIVLYFCKKPLSDELILHTTMINGIVLTLALAINNIWRGLEPLTGITTAFLWMALGYGLLKSEGQLRYTTPDEERHQVPLGKKKAAASKKQKKGKRGG